MLDNSIHAGSGVIAGTVVLQSEAMSLRQEIGELIMYESGEVEMYLVVVPVLTHGVLLELDMPIVAGTRPLVAKIKAPSKDVSVVVGHVEISDDQVGYVVLKAVPSYPVVHFSF